MKEETFEAGDLVYLKNNPKTILVVLFINYGEKITVLFPDGLTSITWPKVAFNKA